MRIEESGMIFGEYAEDTVFYIEKEKPYTDIKSQGISAVEFVVIRNEPVDKIIFVEAKSSAPNPKNGDNKVKFRDFLAGIYKKFTDSFSIFERVWMGKEMNDTFQNIDINGCRIVFLLVINGFEKEWMKAIQEGLSQYLSSDKVMNALWHPSIAVINDQQARDKRLIM